MCGAQGGTDAFKAKTLSSHPAILAVVKNRHGHAGCVRLAFHGAAGIHNRDSA